MDPLAAVKVAPAGTLVSVTVMLSLLTASRSPATVSVQLAVVALVRMQDLVAPVIAASAVRVP
jgi:hypothetical protein